MRRLLFFLLACLLPLQGAWATVVVFHSHQTSHEGSTVDVNLDAAHHLHGHQTSHEGSTVDVNLDAAHHLHGHHHAIDSQAHDLKNLSSPDTHQDGDSEHTNHHCHASSCAFIAGNITILLPSFAAIAQGADTHLNPVHLSDPIYRPNWL